MRTRVEPLLCEFHAHTTWSDGVLTVRELVDLYGGHGFDVLAVTDHVCRTDDPLSAEQTAVRAEDFAPYLCEIGREATRAQRRYGLLVLPGLELTYNDASPELAAHAVAVGLRRHVSVDHGIEDALASAREAGAATIAAHPHRPGRGPRQPGRTTEALARNWRRFEPLVDRWELFNRNDLYAWVAEKGLPGVACGDFHREEHLATWKTLLPCRKEEEAVVGYLRSPRPVYLTRLVDALSQAA